MAAVASASAATRPVLYAAAAGISSSTGALREPKRSIPVLFAVFGMLFVLMSADYLAHPHVQRLHAHVFVPPK